MRKGERGGGHLLGSREGKHVAPPLLLPRSPHAFQGQSFGNHFTGSPHAATGVHAQQDWAPASQAKAFTHTFTTENLSSHEVHACCHWCPRTAGLGACITSKGVHTHIYHLMGVPAAHAAAGAYTQQDCAPKPQSRALKS